MTWFYSPQIDEVLSAGTSMSSMHVNNWSLDRHAAILAIQSLKGMGIAILGGDVIVRANQALHHTYDSWYCDPIDGESSEAYINRSASTAVNYIEAYPKGDYLFAIVPEVKS